MKIINKSNAIIDPILDGDNRIAINPDEIKEVSDECELPEGVVEYSEKAEKKESKKDKKKEVKKDKKKK